MSELNSKHSEISNTVLFLFLNKMLVDRTGVHKILVRIANSEDPDQTASRSSLISVCTVFVGHFGRQIVFIYHTVG